MYCIYCGKELQEGSKICTNCGKILVSSDERNHTIENKIEYIGFWKRFCAYLIDCIALSFIGYIVGFMIALISVLFHITKFSSLFYYVVGIIISWIYFAGMECSKKQATIGKTTVGIKVVNQKGEKISFIQATVRYFSKIISGMIFCIGYIMISLTNKKQGLHDILAKTYVVKK